MPPDNLAYDLPEVDVYARAASIRSVRVGPDRAESGLAFALLRALATMARISKRQQAEVDVAVSRAGLVLSRDQRDAALRHLFDTASIEQIIPLDDGGMILSVTSAGMERALR